MIEKQTEVLGMPWEGLYGYVQAVKVGNTLYLSGQLSHDDQGNMVAPAPLDDDERRPRFGLRRGSAGRPGCPPRPAALPPGRSADSARRYGRS